MNEKPPVEGQDATASFPEEIVVTAPPPPEAKPEPKTYLVPNRHDRRRAKALARKEAKAKGKGK